MSKVEYKVIDMHANGTPLLVVLGNKHIEQRLNEYAEEGWRVVHFHVHTTVLERTVYNPDSVLRG